jgi:hypothetical protein
MEFAVTGPLFLIGSDDSWQPDGSRSFLFAEPLAIPPCAVTGDRLEKDCVSS